MSGLTGYQRAAVIAALAREEDDEVRARELALIAKFEEGDHVIWHESAVSKETVGEVLEVEILGFPETPPDSPRIGYLVEFPCAMGVGREEHVVAEDLLLFVERSEVPR